MKKSILILLFISSVSYSQDWIKVGKDNFGNEFYISDAYLNKGGTLGYDENIIKLWTKKVWIKLEDRRDGKNKVYYNVVFKELVEFDCSEKKYRLISKNVYDSKGNLIISENSEYSDWEYAVPESAGLAVLNTVCTKFY